MNSKNNKTSTSKYVLIAYIPVLHEGYQHLIEKHPEATSVYVLPATVTHKLRSLQKDIRAISAEKMVVALQAVYPKRTFFVATNKILHDLASKNCSVIMPDEDVSKLVVAEFLPENEIVFDSIFLRWDKERSERVYAPSPSTTKETTASFMDVARAEAAKSADWWRQVGAVLVKEGKIILQTHNEHVPNEQAPYILGDPRANFHAGDHIELSTAIHAEAKLIAQAANNGIALKNSELYCTTFPCPPCAKLIAESGIKKLYYSDGYSVLDGEDVLRQAGVVVVKL